MCVGCVGKVKEEKKEAQGRHIFPQIRPRDWAGPMALADTDQLGEKYSITVTWGGETHCSQPSLLPPLFPVSHKVLGKLVTISI